MLNVPPTRLQKVEPHPVRLMAEACRSARMPSRKIHQRDNLLPKTPNLSLRISDDPYLATAIPLAAPKVGCISEPKFKIVPHLSCASLDLHYLCSAVGRRVAHGAPLHGGEHT